MRRNSGSPRVVEDVGDGGLFGGLDLRVGIEETPAQAMRQMAAHGALAGSHEADDVDSGRALQPEDHAVPLMAAMRDSTIGRKQAHGEHEEPAGTGRDHGTGIALHTAADGLRAVFGRDGEAARLLHFLGRLAGADVLLKSGLHVAGADQHGAHAVAHQFDALAFGERAQRGLGDAV